jgi:hypothetical protein
MTDHGTVTPDIAIRDVHLLAEELGFRRLRIDRSGFGGTEQNPACWVEVGYASGEIHIRTSDPELRYRAAPNKLDLDAIGSGLSNLMEDAMVKEEAP